MDILFTAIVFILIFSLLVLIHEFGHYWAAKREGIKVEEFGFGLPPRAWGKKIGETIFSINWIPFGGFVRMLGEDATDPALRKNPRSFISKSKWARTKVVCAGVVMNFLLAFVLLTFGFTVGMEPLIVNKEDVVKAIEAGAFELESGVVVKSVEEGSTAAKFGFKEGDTIIGFEDKVTELDESYLDDVTQGRVGIYELQSKKSTKKLEVSEPLEGIEFHKTQEFPAIKVLESDHQWFLEDTYVLDLSERRLLSLDSLHDGLKSQKTASFKLFQNGRERKVPLKDITRVEYKGVLIENVMANSSADKAGIKAGDRILRVEDQKIAHISDFLDYNQSHGSEKLSYLVQSEEKGFVELDIETDDEGRIGVYITQLLEVGAGLDGKFTLKMDSLPTSVLGVGDVKYPFYQAPIEAIKEMGRLSVLTADMFVDVIKDVVTSGEVADSVAGPVGIAAITHDVVQDGLFATLRFIALLSLSLGVINILPLPALDGGRLLFIIVEAVRGKPVNQKYEAYIHSIGFLLLMLLILVVTFHDFLKFF